MENSNFRGNDCAKALVERSSLRFTLDVFECAIHRLEPIRGEYGGWTVGPVIQAERHIYCCVTAPRTTAPWRLESEWADLPS